VFDKVTITYRGAKYEIGRGKDFYGIWPVGTPRGNPLEWWPETAEGWSAAWTRYASIEAPGTIVPVGRRTPPVPQATAPAAESMAQAGPSAAGPAAESPAGEGATAEGATAQSATAQSPGAAGLTAGAGAASTAGAAPVAGAAAVAGASAGDAAVSGGTTEPQEPATGPLAGHAVTTGEYASPFGPQTAPYDQYTPAYGQGTPGSGTGRRFTPVLGGAAGSVLAVGLIGAGLVLGIAGLFPSYLGASLASDTSLLIPHVIYLATWALAAVLIFLGGSRSRFGALLGVGISAVTFGLFLSDAGTAISGGATAGTGLILSYLGWLACAAGSLLALRYRPAAGEPTGRPLSRPRGAALGPAVMVVLAGLGVAAAFAPSWDSFALRTASGQAENFTAGNAFSYPGWIVAGNVLVMVALAAVIIAAALWRPVRHGAVLLAGAAIPMVAQAISALIAAGQAPSPTQFGLTPAQATRIGLTISPGLTPAFWIYCGFLVALIVSCAWMLFTPHDAPGRMTGTAAYGWHPAPAGHLAGQPGDLAGRSEARDEDIEDDEPEFVTAPPGDGRRPGDQPA
jgi:hypothetical protein